MLSAEVSGSTDNTENFLVSLQKMDIRGLLERAGEEGLRALRAAIPHDSGLASESWYYEIQHTNTGVGITWYNSDVENGFPVAIMLQYGYATGTGGYVAGRDYINPAMRPIFDQLSLDIWKAVNSK